MNLSPSNNVGINKEGNISVIYSTNPINPQHTITHSIELEHISQEVNCPSCKKQVQTKVKYVAGILTWLSFFCLMFFGIICGVIFLFLFVLIFLSFIPFCFNKFKDCVHQCSECNTYFGTYKRLGSKKSLQIFL